jgi:hypothetical protein
VQRSGDGFVLSDGTPVTVRVGDSRDGSVASYERTADGRYEVTVSRRASDEDVARAVAHEVAEIHTRETGVPDGPNALANDGPLSGGAELSAHDHGRIAELRVLADQVSASNDLRARHELQSLLDALGVRDGRADADARLDLIRPHLDPETLAAVERMRQPQPLRLEAGDVDTMARIFDADPRFTADRKALEDKLKDARNGNEGALGELEAIQRWLAEGRTVQMLPTVENQAGRRNPDFLVDGRVVEVKTTTADVGDRGIRRDVADVADQIKKAGPDARGAAHLQLHGDAANASLDNIESQVRRQFNQNRSSRLDEVSVYKDGVLAGQWVRNEDGSVTRRFPPPAADAQAPSGPTPNGPAPRTGGDPLGTGASSAIPDSSYHNDASNPDRAAVEAGVATALPRLTAHGDPRTGSVRVNDDGSLAITAGDQTRNARVEVVPADRMLRPTDVANFDVSTDPMTIRVAEGVDPHHVERALAHEVAEISSIMRHESPDSDGPTARADGLDHDDIGRVAELRVLLVDPDPRRAGEVDALLEHMNVLGDDPATVARRHAIEAELGHPLPTTPAQRRAFDDARDIYNAIASDPYQGPEAARAAWAARLSEDGIDVAGRRDRSRDDLSAQGANPDAARGRTDAGHELPASAVLPDQPADPRPYTAADRDRAAELRDAMQRIEDIDRTLAQRDRQGDQAASAATGAGDSDRRMHEVERVRKLLDELQLGGTDPAYLNRRLDELHQLFPDLDLRGGVTQRADNRRRAEEAHARADEARGRNAQRQQDLIDRIHAADPPAVDRLVIGSGIAGLTDAATLPGSRDYPGMLMLGTADPIGQRNPAARWGQRTGAYDSHPLFGQDGPGATHRTVEDPGEFIHIGELNDAMDIARDEMGVAPYPGTAGTIERRDTAGAGTWPDNGYPYRVPVAGPDGTTRYVYAHNIDVTSGPGGTRMPNRGILSPGDLDTLRGRGDVIGGSDLLNERAAGGDDPEGRVFVYSYGLTGAWAARHSTTEVGAARVDWGGSGGTRESNDRQLAGTRATDRTRDAFGDSRIAPTTDPVVRMRPGDPRGVVVTFNGPDGTYDVHYNRVAVAMGFDAGGPSGAHGEQPSSRQLLGDTPMGLDPAGGPTLQNADGSIRVFGAAATSGPGLSRDDVGELRRRQAAEVGQLTGDSPTPDTVEFGGRTIGDANRALAARTAGDSDATPTTEPDLGGTASNIGDFRGDARRGDDLTELQMRSMVGNNLRLINPGGARYDATDHTFTLAGGQRVRVEVGTPRDGSVASFEPHGDGFVVTVSSRARDEDVVRALSHELAEINAGRRVGDDVARNNHDDRPDELTTHLLGRYAEVNVLVDQLFQAHLSAQSGHADRIGGDLRQLLDALGMTPNHPDAHERLQRLAQHDQALLDRLRTIAPGMVHGSPPRRPDRAGPQARPDRLDSKVSRLSREQQAYYDQILARHPDPTSKKARKKAYAAAKKSRPLSEADVAVVNAARERLASMRLNPIVDPNNPNQVQMEITFDGTWNSRDDMVFDTNPALLTQMFHGLSDYQVGVGTTLPTAALGGLSGAGITNRINHAYDNLVRQINEIKQQNPDAEVVLITAGFSRGSTAARAFTNELVRRGVPDLTSPRGRDGNHTRYHEPPRIGAMVLFDTVGSVGIPGTNWNPGLDLSIPAQAENVLHLTSGGEYRAAFPLSSVVDPSRPDDDRINEVELPGAHSDVGGSLPNPYTQIALQYAQDYLHRLGVDIDPVNPDDLVDPADPSLRLHTTGLPPMGPALLRRLWRRPRRRVYDSHNPAPAPRGGGEGTDPE